MESKRNVDVFKWNLFKNMEYKIKFYKHLF